EQTIAPYAISWDTTAATNAAHTLTAVARDAAGNAATSAPVTITVSNLPCVSVSPSSVAFDGVTCGTTSAAHNVQVTNAGSVGVSVSSVTSTGPFAISQNYCVANGSWNGVMAPGTHCDVFVAFAPVVGGNATGTLSISAAAVVYPITLAGMGVAPADTTPPTVSIASPGNGTTGYGSAIPVVSGLVTAHTVTLNSLAAGTLYHYRAKSKDAAGNLAVSPDAVLTTAPAPDTTPPAVSISTPAANSSVSGTITVI